MLRSDKPGTAGGLLLALYAWFQDMLRVRFNNARQVSAEG